MPAKKKSHTHKSHASSSHSHAKGSRAVKGFFSIFILAALVLSVAYFVKFVSTLNAHTLSVLSEPLIYKAGLDPNQVEQVAGIVSQRFGQTGVVEDGSTVAATTVGDEAKNVEKVLSFSVALASDSHNFNGILKTATESAKNRGINTMLFLGDCTDWGDITSLENAKEVMDAAGLTYYSLPGDHDLAQSVGVDNYTKVFGSPNTTFEIQGVKFVLFDNSANYTALTEDKMNWFASEITNADFVVLSQPLFTLSGVRTMGVIDGVTTQDVKKQADNMLDLIRDSHVKAVIAGDLHAFSNLSDPEKPELRHIVLGAVKAGKYAVLNVYENGDFEVEDVVLESGN